MEMELNALLNSVKVKTGIDVDVYANTGDFFTSTREVPSATVCPSDVSEVRGEITQNKTYFPFRYHRTDLVGVIDGAGEIERKYALLLTDVLQGQTSANVGLTKEEELRRMLLGECDKTQVRKFCEKYALPDYGCFVLVFPAGSRNEEIVDFIVSYDENRSDCTVLMEDGSCAFVKFLDKETVSVFQSPGEYAETFVNSVKMELGFSVQVGVGNVVHRFDEVNLSYQQAATAIRMAATFSSKGNVHTYREYLLVRMLEDVPKFKLKEYLESLLLPESKSVLADEDLINTAEEFLENSLNVSETSRNLYMHRNTLMYRLDKIEKLTGLNIRNFEDAVSFRLIMVLFKMLS